MIIKSLTIVFLLIFILACGVQRNDSYSILDNFKPSGYMGDFQNIVLKKNYKDSSRPDSLCTKINYTPGDRGFGGVYWQYPENNWCKQKGKDFSRSGFKRITLFAKGEQGGEEVKFKVGQDCGDSFVSEELTGHLTKKWEKFTIDIKGVDLSNVTGAFCWVVDSKANNGVVTFYIDDVQFEK